MLGTARLLGQTIGAALVALLLARYPTGGTRVALLVGVGFAMSGAALSTLRLSPAGARGARSGACAGRPTRHRRVIDAGSGSRILRLCRKIPLPFGEKSFETVCFDHVF
jgi:hypothetical protein